MKKGALVIVALAVSLVLAPSVTRTVPMGFVLVTSAAAAPASPPGLTPIPSSTAAVPIAITAGGDPVTVTITNADRSKSTSALKVTLSETPSTAGFFISSDLCSGVALGPRKSCTVTVAYGATAPATQETATLTVASKTPRVSVSSYFGVEPNGLQQCISQSEIVEAIVDESGFKSELFRLINEYRQQNGLRTLQRVEILENVAQSHSIFMEQFGTLSHDVGFGDETDRISGAGYDVTVCLGETIGIASSPQEILAAWKASAAQNTVLLTPALTHIGIGLEAGCGTSSSFGLWWTADFGCSSDTTHPAAQSGPAVNAQTLADQLVGYLQAADAAYAAGDEGAVISNFVSFVNLWAEPPERGGPWLRSNCALTERVASCFSDVLDSLSFPATNFDGDLYMTEIWGVTID